MDVLIDLIIYLIRQVGKAREQRARAARAQNPGVQKAQLEQQALALRKMVNQQQARTRAVRPVAQAKGVRPVASTPRSWAQPAVSAVVPPVRQEPVPPISGSSPRGRAPRAGIPGMRLPFLLGEVLAPPVALRDAEF